MTEVLKLAARPAPYDSDERTWMEFRFKLENYLTLLNEKYVTLLQDAASQPVANVPAGLDESSLLIRGLSLTLYALLATLTTGRSLRLVQRVPNRNGFEVRRQMVAENAPKTAGRRFAMLQAVLQPGLGDNPAKFVEAWNAWEHQLDVYEKLATSKLDDDVKISAKARGKGKGKGKDEGNGKGKGKGTKPDNQDRECYVSGKRGQHQDRTVNEADGAKADPDTAKSLCLRLRISSNMIV